jgi:hypothetical protein
MDGYSGDWWVKRAKQNRDSTGDRDRHYR